MKEMNRIALVGSLLACAAASNAQWMSYKLPGTPRTGNGAANLTAPAPRTADGKPDLSGVWQAQSAPPKVVAPFLLDGVNGLGEDLPNLYFLNLFADYPLDKPPLQPAALQLFGKNSEGMGKNSPVIRCLPEGVPLAELSPAPFKIAQMPGLTILLLEENNQFHQIFTDNRKHTADPDPTWYGYSVGHWEKDAFVVETTGFNDRGWLDAFGHPHSEALKITQRLTRRDYGHIDLEIGIDDARMLLKPVTVKTVLELKPDTDLIENICAENEKDAQHLAGLK
jgi:hypothetical protein